MSNKVRIVASYGEIKKLAIIDKNMTLKENIYNLKKCFNIEPLEIKLKHLEFDAIIEDVELIEAQEKIGLVLSNFDEQKAPETVDSSEESTETKNEVANQVNADDYQVDYTEEEKEATTDVTEILLNNYRDRAHLVDQMKTWALTNFFEIKLQEGEKKLAHRVFKTVIGCKIRIKEKPCAFKLVFKTKESDGKYYLETFQTRHNHNLNNTQIINDKVIRDIEKLKNKFKTTESLKKHLNSEHKLKLSYNQVHYQSMKAHQLLFGQPSEDSKNLISLLQLESQKMNVNLELLKIVIMNLNLYYTYPQKCLISSIYMMIY